MEWMSYVLVSVISIVVTMVAMGVVFRKHIKKVVDERNYYRNELNSTKSHERIEEVTGVKLLEHDDAMEILKDKMK